MSASSPPRLAFPCLQLACKVELSSAACAFSPPDAAKLMQCSQVFHTAFSEEELWEYFCHHVGADLTDHCIHEHDFFTKEYYSDESWRSHFRTWIIMRREEQLRVLLRKSEASKCSDEMLASSYAQNVAKGFLSVSAACIAVSGSTLKTTADELLHGSKKTAGKRATLGAVTLGLGVGFGAVAAFSAALATGVTVAEKADKFALKSNCGNVVVLKLPNLFEAGCSSQIRVSNCLRKPVVLRVETHSLEVAIDSRTDRSFNMPVGYPRRVEVSLLLPGRFGEEKVGFFGSKMGSSFLICRPEDDVMKLALGRCPKGHLLSKSACASKWQCARCSRKVNGFLEDIKSYSCSSCKHSICKECYHDKIRNKCGNVGSESRASA